MSLLPRGTPPAEPPSGVLVRIAWQAGVDLWHQHTPAPENLQLTHCRRCATAWPCLTVRYLGGFLDGLTPVQRPVRARAEFSDRRAIFGTGSAHKNVHIKRPAVIALVGGFQPVQRVHYSFPLATAGLAAGAAYRRSGTPKPPF